VYGGCISLLLLLEQNFTNRLTTNLSLIIEDRREKMRSDLIFGALRPVRNRYTLCQLAAQATRKFHKPNSRIQETMNDVLVRFSKASSAERVMHGSGLLENKLARSQRQAA
jgi:hypothetical protein